ncbi:MAG: hypothetical protein AAF456_16970 [Planctomycetota bacterium]
MKLTKSPSILVLPALLLAICWTLSDCNDGEQPGGTGPEESEVVARALPDMTVAIVGDSVVGPIFERQWAASHDSKITIVDVNPEEFIAGDFELAEQVDVIIYPPAMIGELVSRRRIEEVPGRIWSDTEHVNNRELLRHSRRTLVTFKKSVFAVPLGSPVASLMYRQDVLDAIDAGIPQSWEEFDRVVSKLVDAQTIRGEGGQDLPTDVQLPLAEGRAAQMLLVRVAPYVRARGQTSTIFDRDTMDPLIESEPFVRALSELKTIIRDVQPDEIRSAEEVFLNIVSGQSAMAICWPSAAFPQDDIDALDSIGITRIPGSPDYFNPRDGWLERPGDDSPHVDVIGFDGLVASLWSDSPNALAAHELLRWLPAKMNSVKACPPSVNSGPFRASHLGNPQQWTGKAVSSAAAQQYADTLRACNEASVSFIFPRIPGRMEYLNALNEAVLSCLKGDVEPEEALKNAADKWREITNSRGPAVQSQALKNSQGI